VTRPLKLFLIAGEPSGDKLGAALMAGLNQLTAGDITFYGVGGPMMAAEGLTSLFPMSDLSVMGLMEVIPQVPKLLARIRQTARAVVDLEPDALITIDSPDFCLRVVRRVRPARPDLKTIHYVAPSVWAWRPERAEKMARVVDHVLALLPFEPPYMHRAGMTCDFVGHPVAAEAQATAAEVAAMRAELGVEAGKDRLITLLPGSRAGEISRLQGIFGEVAARVARKVPEVKFVLPAAPGVLTAVKSAVIDWPVKLTILNPGGFGVQQAEARKRAVFAASDLALAASGTVSLELAAAACPMVIAYKANWLTTRMVKKMALIDTATLVNILADSRTVPELLFENCTAGQITPQVTALLQDRARRDAQLLACDKALRLLGTDEPEPGLRAAKSVLAAVG
jgi:lipid-A-disaccharide synthase